MLLSAGDLIYDIIVVRIDQCEKPPIDQAREWLKVLIKLDRTNLDKCRASS